MLLTVRLLQRFSKVGFIGLGNMGFPMAVNLAKKGHQVIAFDIDPSKETEAIKNNIVFKKSMKEVTDETDVFMMLVPKSEHSISVCESEGGLFHIAKPGSLIIDSSTIAPKVAVSLNQSAKKYNMTYLDAPVTGAVPAAMAGTLNFLVGAESEEVFQRAMPIMQAMGKRFFNCGKPGAGQVVKICNNMSLATQMISISEAFVLGKSLGIDQKILSNILKVSSSSCWSMDTYNPVPGVLENVPSSRNYQRGFDSVLMLKDVGLATEMAHQIGIKTDMADKTKQIYEILNANGYAKKDFGIIYQLLATKKI